MEEYRRHGGFRLDQATHREIATRFLSASISDEATLSTIRGVFERTGGYALDPHAAVAVAAAAQASDRIAADAKVLCFATAHPAKFPAVLRQALGLTGPLPAQLTHESIERARSLPERCLAFDYATMNSTVRQAMEGVTARRRG
jgi:threonine synthase